MIVKNESHIIKNTLEKLLGKIKIDYWVICDTGSTDETPNIITTFFEERGIKGELYHHTWKNFEYNRTLALNKAYNKSEYLLIFDADDEIMGNFQLPDFLSNDAYSFSFGGNVLSYERILLVNNKLKWKFNGVLHEFISLEDNTPFNEGKIIGDYTVVSGRNSDRNKMDPKEKYLQDAKILEQAYNDTGNVIMKTRYAYYCGNSYKDCGNLENAEKWYFKVLELQEGWYEEKYQAALFIGEKNLNYEPLKGIEYLLKTHKYNPNRVEGIYYLIQFYLSNNDPEEAWKHYLYIKEYYENKYLDDVLSTKLFARGEIYSLLLPYIMIVICYKLKESRTALKLFTIFFTKKEPFPKENLYLIRRFIQLSGFFTFDDTLNKLKTEYINFLEKIGILIDNTHTKVKCTNKKMLIFTGFTAKEPWNYTYSLTNAIGGSEKAVIYLSKQFPKEWDITIAGYHVPEKIDNISYIHYSSLQPLLKENEFEVIIVSRFVSFFDIFLYFKCNKLYLMAHDTELISNDDTRKTEIILAEWGRVIDSCVCLTEFHKVLYTTLYPVLSKKIKIINNGIVLDLFQKTNYKIKNSFIYSSSSKRGLVILLELWKKIKELLPDATLNIASYEDFPLHQEDFEMEKIIKENQDSIKHLGKLNTTDLYCLMSKSEFWMYPCIFPETSCITAMEMLMSEVICLYYPFAGLKCTIGDYGIPMDKGYELKALNMSEDDKDSLRVNGKYYAMTCSWKTRAKQWEKLINN